jgi:hypothetical protein
MPTPIRGAAPFTDGGNPSMSNPFLGALFGMRNFVVQINYPKRSPGKEGAFREAYVILNACGDILDTYGSSESDFSPVNPSG